MIGNMNDRPIDFYIKGLPFDARQEIFKRLDAVGCGKIEKLLEKPIGYPRYRSVGYTNEQIIRQEAKSTTRFAAVNAILAENGRPPLFSDPSDTYQSAMEYAVLLQKHTAEELIERFGCLWDEYVPIVDGKSC